MTIPFLPILAMYQKRQNRWWLRSTIESGKTPNIDEMLCHEWFTGYSAVIPKTLPQSALTTEPTFTT